MDIGAGLTSLGVSMLDQFEIANGVDWLWQVHRWIYTYRVLYLLVVLHDQLCKLLFTLIQVSFKIARLLLLSFHLLLSYFKLMYDCGLHLFEVTDCLPVDLILRLAKRFELADFFIEPTLVKVKSVFLLLPQFMFTLGQTVPLWLHGVAARLHIALILNLLNLCGHRLSEALILLLLGFQLLMSVGQLNVEEPFLIFREFKNRSDHRVYERSEELKLPWLAFLSALFLGWSGVDRPIFSHSNWTKGIFLCLDENVGHWDKVTEHTRKDIVMVSQIEQVFLNGLLDELFEKRDLDCSGYRSCVEGLLGERAWPQRRLMVALNSLALEHPLGLCVL